MLDTEIVSPNSGDFIQRTFEIIATCQTEAITANQAVGIYSLGFSFARDIAKLDQLQAVLFAMEYGNFILRFLQRSSTFMRYLTRQFNTSTLNRRETIAKSLRDRYIHVGVDPNPIDACGAMHTLLTRAFIVDRGLSTQQFTQQLSLANPIPSLIANPDSYSATHSEATEYALSEFNRVLGDVQTGQYLVLQENSADT